MSAASNYLENELLDHVFGGGDYARSATLYVGLFTSAPNDAGGGVEVAGGSYARAAVTNDATEWPAAVSGQKKNANPITFPTATADWGTVVACAIFDAASGGNMLWHKALTDSRAVLNGDTFRFPTDKLVITAD